jgi:hypothetical protein
MKIFCLDCFLDGRVFVLDPNCPNCGGSKGLVKLGCDLRCEDRECRNQRSFHTDMVIKHKEILQ